MKTGDKVTIGAKGVSIFVVVGEDEERPDRVVIESVEEVPGRYPFPMRRSELVPHTEA